MVAELRNNRDYRNPNFMEKIVSLFQISQYGSCFPAHVLDPEGMPPEDFAGAIVRRLERQVLSSPTAPSPPLCLRSASHDAARLIVLFAVMR